MTNERQAELLSGPTIESVLAANGLEIPHEPKAETVPTITLTASGLAFGRKPRPSDPRIG